MTAIPQAEVTRVVRDLLAARDDDRYMTLASLAHAARASLTKTNVALAVLIKAGLVEVKSVGGARRRRRDLAYRWRHG